MTVKKLFLLTFLTFGYLTINAQFSGFQNDASFTESVISNFESIRIFNETGRVVKLSNIKGSPYENDTFILGKAANKKINNTKPYYLRYNIYNDVIEIKNSDNNIISLIKSLNIYAIILNREYHFEIYSDNDKKTREGYFILLTKGKNSSLYLKKNKKFKDKVPVKDSYTKEQPATFVDSESYYFKRNDERVLLPISINKKKQFLKQFPEFESKLKKYMKSEKINLKSEKDIIKLHVYLDSLLK